MSLSARTGPETRLLLDLDLNGFIISLIQRKESLDSFYLVLYIALPEAQRGEFNSLDEDEKRECVTELVSVFAGNCGLGGFELEPDGAYDFKQVTAATKRIYFDALTKDRLFSSISDLIRAYAGISSVLERHTGMAGAAKPAAALSFYM